MKKYIALIACSIWISFSEFLRNQILFQYLWVNHYDSLGLKFETIPVNGLMWTAWSFLLAYMLLLLNEKFSVNKTFAISWLSTFPMMWIALFNLQVLPLSLIPTALPLSMFEILLGILIIKKIYK